MAQEIDTSLAGKDLSGRDLRGYDFTGKSLFGTELSGAQLYGAKIDIACHTFDGLKIDDTQIATLLLMFGMADIDASWKSALEHIVRIRVGDDRLSVLRRYLQLA